MKWCPLRTMSGISSHPLKYGNISYKLIFLDIAYSWATKEGVLCWSKSIVFFFEYCWNKFGKKSWNPKVPRSCILSQGILSFSNIFSRMSFFWDMFCLHCFFYYNSKWLSLYLSIHESFVSMKLSLLKDGVNSKVLELCLWIFMIL